MEKSKLVCMFLSRSDKKIKIQESNIKIKYIFEILLKFLKIELFL